ncbi:family 16 glycosylhydrolase [Ideonella sp. DXS29W]|uniref:Family 16 glycosylhydrolase n=1 Tax=Ideonella lacteola TaxID=2984193 RepID=A0ABU9BJ01_9BURK
MYFSSSSVPTFGAGLTTLLFALAGAATSAQAAPLISTNKRAYASTTESSQRLAANVIDGAAGTRWASGVTPRAWLMVDLGAPATIEKIEIDWERAWSSKYDIEVSNDNKKWIKVGTTQTNPFVKDGVTPNPPPAEYNDVVLLNLTQTYRYIRVNSLERGWSDFNGGQYGVSALEVRVFGTGGADNPKAIKDPKPGKGDWDKVWADEFQSAGTPERLDLKKWNYVIGDGCDRGICGWGNGEREYYTDSLDNVYMKDGLLNITLRKNHLGHNYTSGRITTAGKFEFTYGKVEARIRMQTPASPTPGAKDGPVGVWGAFWLLGFNVDDPYYQWPNAGEIDIVENIGYSWWHSSALHGPGYSGGGPIGGAFNKVDTPSGIAIGDNLTFSSTDWHTYQVIWSDKKFQFFVDNKLYREIKRDEVEARGVWVYNKPNYIIMNLAYDGSYPAAYRNNPANFTGTKTGDGLATLAENNFPHTMQVDWVRVFQRLP